MPTGAFTPHVLDRNFTDFTVQLQFLLQEGLLALEHVPSVPLSELAMRGEALRLRTLSVFGLDDA